MSNNQPQDPAPNDKQQEQWTPPASQEDLNRIIASRLSRQKEQLEKEYSEKYADYEDLKAKAASFDEIEEGRKSELQKALDRAEAAEKAIAEREAAEAQRVAEERAAQELAELRKSVADAKGVDVNVLRGDTREELEAHADVLKPLITSHPVIPGQGDTPDKTPSEEATFVRGLFGGE